MRVPPSTRLCSMRKATLTVDSPKVAPQLVRMAGLAIAVVAAEGDAGTVVGGNRASLKKVTAAALVGEVALGYVDAVRGLVFWENYMREVLGEGERTRRLECRSRCRTRHHVCAGFQDHVQRQWLLSKSH
jgi:hypothetical protein